MVQPEQMQHDKLLAAGFPIQNNSWSHILFTQTVQSIFYTIFFFLDQSFKIFSEVEESQLTANEYYRYYLFEQAVKRFA